jgi:hypothetical protein
MIPYYALKGLLIGGGGILFVASGVTALLYGNLTDFGWCAVGGIILVVGLGLEDE